MAIVKIVIYRSHLCYHFLVVELHKPLQWAIASLATSQAFRCCSIALWSITRLGDINIRLILNKEVLQKSHERKTNLFKKFITELWIGNQKILEEFALKGMMLGLGCNLKGWSYTNVAPIFFRCLIIILSYYIIRALPNFLLQLTMNDLHQFECWRNGKSWWKSISN